MMNNSSHFTCLEQHGIVGVHLINPWSV